VRTYLHVHKNKIISYADHKNKNNFIFAQLGFMLLEVVGSMIVIWVILKESKLVIFKFEGIVASHTFQNGGNKQYGI